MKKILTGIFAVVLLLGLHVYNPIDVYGASQYEYEDNDSYETANIVALGGSVSGNISEEKDADYYMILPNANGKIELEFCHTFKDSDHAWSVSVYVNDNGQYAKLSGYSIALSSKESIALPTIGAVQGRTYYILVTRYASYCSKVIGEDYTIKTTFTESNNYEKELNNDYGSATAIELNQTYGGTLGKGEDKDYYKMIAPANGKIALEFGHTFKDNDHSWGVYVYTYTDGQYSKLSEYRIVLNNKESIDLSTIGAVRGRTYYIIVTQYASYCSEVIGEDYTLKTKFYINSPSYFNAKVNKKTAKLTWGKVSGADGYEIYYKAAGGNGKYKKLNVTTKNSYTYQNLKKGRTYYFKVRAYKKIENTKYYSTFTLSQKVKRG